VSTLLLYAVPVKRPNLALHWKPIIELQSLTCHMGLHIVTCHPTHVSVSHLSSAK